MSPSHQSQGVGGEGAVMSAAPKPGTYRNHLGAELHVGTAMDLRALGLRLLGPDAVLATLHDGLLGSRIYVVTAASLLDCGYERVEVEE